MTIQLFYGLINIVAAPHGFNANIQLRSSMINNISLQLLSILYATSTLLPVFLFTQLSLFTAIGILYLGLVYTNTYYNLSKKGKAISIEEGILIIDLLRFFFRTYLIISYPALFYAKFLLSHARIFTNNYDLSILFSKFLSIFNIEEPNLNSSDYFKMSFIIDTYSLTISFFIMSLIAPYLPLPAIEISKNHLPLCLLMNSLSEKIVQHTRLSLKNIIFGMENNTKTA